MKSQQTQLAPATAPRRKEQPKPRLRTPRTAAFVVTLLPAALEKGLTYAKVIAEAKAKINLSSLGIGTVKIRQSVTGAKLLEISGAGSAEKADALAAKMQELLGLDSAKVSRPMRYAELRISGVDDSVTSDEIAAAVANDGGCPADDIKCGEVRIGPSGLGTAWLRCPEGPAKKVIEGDRLLVGWMSAQVRLLPRRAICCFRCLEAGHVRVKCSSDVDRSAQCYRCGQLGHKAATCTSAAHCTLCAANGNPADHRVGSQKCAAYSEEEEPSPGQCPPAAGPYFA